MAWDFSGGMPIYIQIANKLKLRIFSGMYSEGMKIPSVRDIASEASANPNTVVKALTMLCDEGIIYAKSTAGNFVTEDRSVIDAARERTAAQITAEFADTMAHIGLSREKADALLEKYLRKDNVNGNNTGM
ncbi:MAG: GntR family transcriptional regulator [Eubacteriales bacterium]